MKNKIPFLSKVLVFSLLVASPSRADDAMAIAGCLSEVKTVCTGLENEIEQCLNERAAQFSPACQSDLKRLITTTATNPGLQSCVNDIQSACPSMDGVLLTKCINDKESTFSKPCLDYLQPPAAGDK